MGLRQWVINFKNKTETVGTVLNASTTIQPTVIAKVNGEKARIMFDTGAGSSYICTNLLTKLKLKPTQNQRNRNWFIIVQLEKTLNHLH